MSGFSSGRTQPAFRLGWAGRHFGALGGAGGLVATALITLIAALVQGIDPIKAVTQYGIPTGVCVCLATALGWVVFVYLPRREAQEIEERGRIYDQHREQIEHQREVMAAERDMVDRRRGEDHELFRETITSILASHAADRAEIREVKAALHEVRSQFERVHDRLDSLTTGQRVRIPREIEDTPPVRSGRTVVSVAPESKKIRGT